MSSGSDSRQLTPLTEAGHDPNDPSQRLYDDDDPPATHIGDPAAEIDGDQSDNDSILSDVDEAQFEDFDPANVAIDDRPAIAVDEDNVRLLGRHKRKRDGEVGDGEGVKKKKKEGKREKTKKLRKRRDGDDEDDFSGGPELEGKRFGRKKSIAEGGGGARKEKSKVRKATPENEEALDPEESEFGLSYCSSIHLEYIDISTYAGRRRALDRAMDAALKNPTKRRRKADGIVCLSYLYIYGKTSDPIHRTSPMLSTKKLPHFAIACP